MNAAGSSSEGSDIIICKPEPGDLKIYARFGRKLFNSWNSRGCVVQVIFKEIAQIKQMELELLICDLLFSQDTLSNLSMKM